MVPRRVSQGVGLNTIVLLQCKYSQMCVFRRDRCSPVEGSCLNTNQARTAASPTCHEAITAPPPYFRTWFDHEIVERLLSYCPRADDPGSTP